MRNDKKQRERRRGVEKNAGGLIKDFREKKDKIIIASECLRLLYEYDCTRDNMFS